MLKSEITDQIAGHVRAIMGLLNVPVTVSTKKTPARVAKMYVTELFSSLDPESKELLKQQITLFPNPGSFEDFIIVRGIHFDSNCEHHLLPFSGFVNVGYIPNENIIGLSKIPRVVKHFSKMPQVQERLIKDIADFLYDYIHPNFLIVTAKAVHSCIMCRGRKLFVTL